MTTFGNSAAYPTMGDKGGAARLDPIAYIRPGGWQGIVT